MRESGECYVFDDDRIWHMLTRIETLEVNQFAYRDTVTFDPLPDRRKPLSQVQYRSFPDRWKQIEGTRKRKSADRGRREADGGDWRKARLA